MQNYLDAKHPSLCVDSDGDNSDDSCGSIDGFALEIPTVTIMGRRGV
jgi:hypothetical protein